MSNSTTDDINTLPPIRMTAWDFWKLDSLLKARADGLTVIEAQERIRIDIFLRDNLP